VTENRPPHRLVNFLFPDVSAYHRTLTDLHVFSEQRPEVRLIPSHCEATLEKFAIPAR
jgi:hypothetical protein